MIRFDRGSLASPILVGLIGGALLGLARWLSAGDPHDVFGD